MEAPAIPPQGLPYNVVALVGDIGSATPKKVAVGRWFRTHEKCRARIAEFGENGFAAGESSTYYTTTYEHWSTYAGFTWRVIIRNKYWCIYECTDEEGNHARFLTSKYKHIDGKRVYHPPEIGDKYEWTSTYVFLHDFDDDIIALSPKIQKIVDSEIVAVAIANNAALQ